MVADLLCDVCHGERMVLPLPSGDSGYCSRFYRVCGKTLCPGRPGLGTGKRGNGKRNCEGKVGKGGKGT